jgi:uncharacterized Zn-binding protein involved in type VI secretion
MQKIIRLGDATSHGGKVVSATSHMTVGGLPIARLGDKCTCPKRGHNNCVIVEGDTAWTIDGIPVALEGHKTSCGAVLISSSPNAGRENWGSAESSTGQMTGSVLNQAFRTNPEQEQAPDFDEQLRFVTANGKPYSNLRYKLLLADGSSVAGKTDNDGKTQRVATDTPLVITQAELYSSATTCCTRHTQESLTATATQVIELQGVETNPNDIGSSVVEVTPEGEDRPLTNGEIEMCQLIFKEAINYSIVRVHNHEYFPFGLQDDDTAVTPNGEIYFNPKHFKPDFSQETGFLKHWFMHEMTHVWQYQLNYPVKARGAIRVGLNYQYTLNQEQRLTDFNMEAQGEVLADYYVLKHLNDPRPMREPQYSKDLSLYELVLQKFLESPSDESNLPY